MRQEGTILVAAVGFDSLSCLTNLALAYLTLKD
jgi:hypothetical protein